MDEECRKAREVYSLAQYLREPQAPEDLAKAFEHFDTCDACKEQLMEAERVAAFFRPILEQTKVNGAVFEDVVVEEAGPPVKHTLN